MKKVLALLLVFLLLSGCRNSNDINERVIVQGIGIDKGVNKKYLVTVQALNSDTYSGIGGTKVPENLVENYFLEGDSVAEALAYLPQTAGKKPLYTHTRIIVVGLSLAKDGIGDILDFFARDSNCNVRMYVAVCKGNARDLFSSTEDSESIPSVEMENAVKSSRLSLDSVSVHIYEFLKMFGENTTDPYLPFLNSVKKDEKVMGINCSGAAVFKGFNEILELDGNQVALLNLLSGNVCEGTYNLKWNEDITASFDFYKYRIKKTFRIDENGKPLIAVNIKCVFDNVEYSSSDNEPLDDAAINGLERMLEKQLEAELKVFLDCLCKQNNSDCARIGRVILLENPQFFKNSFENNENRFHDFVFDVNAEVRIRRIGQLN